MKTLLAIFLLTFCSLLHAEEARLLTAFELNQILLKPQSPELNSEELKAIFPAREYTLETRFDYPDGSMYEDTGRAYVKSVDGKYLVTEIHPKGGPEGTVIQMITEYVSSQEVFRKYVVSKGELKGVSIGIWSAESNTMFWVSGPPDHQEWDSNSAFEHYGENEVSWKSIYLKDNQVVLRDSGVAKPVKK